MRKIRIGKDIVLKWAILTNGEAVSLEGRNLKLFIIDSMCRQTELTFSVSGNIIQASFKGVQQKISGVYRLTLWENYNEENQSVVDYCDVFELVNSTCEENDDIEGVQTETILNLGISNFEIISKNGVFSVNFQNWRID